MPQDNPHSQAVQQTSMESLYNRFIERHSWTDNIDPYLPLLEELHDQFMQVMLIWGQGGGGGVGPSCLRSQPTVRTAR